MLPEFFARNPSLPVVLSMEGSVGTGGRNLVPDVKLVQSLLNAVPASVGGPSVKLTVDGQVGAKTIAAIRNYQQLNTKVVDGRVDPRGRMIRHMVDSLQFRGAIPVGVPGIERAKPETVSSFTSLRSDFGIPFITPTTWRIESATSVNASWKDRGLYVAQLVLVEDSAPTVKVRLHVRAGIVGASVGLPAGFDFSLPSFPSVGGRIVRGLVGFGPLSASSFVGLCGVSMIGGNSIGVGEGATIYQFNWNPGGPLGTCSGFAMIAGIQGGLPGFGAASGSGPCTPI